MSCERLGGIKKRANTRKSNKFRVTLATTTKNGHTKQKGSERFEKNERLSKKKAVFRFVCFISESLFQTNTHKTYTRIDAYFRVRHTNTINPKYQTVTLFVISLYIFVCAVVYIFLSTRYRCCFPIRFFDGVKSVSPLSILYSICVVFVRSRRRKKRESKTECSKMRIVR